ncbi:ABC-F family ATP-binding cassette domain-containing protein [Eisenbergiella sp.]|uniref:ABC-F family ATP-binding cassette domain-containing protein n=1 Tax=Eisenbergiella sp. TaxID=1924109 RepID=UPI002A81EF7C|nr:ABC-F family ATP-binding cassette domain-containing protein [Eisenbergiella sp.]
MNILTVENITKSYGERKLFDNASFYLQEGEKVGVIGINGTGKSTLLKIMAGTEEPDEGNVTRANHVVVRFLSQQPVFDPGDTILESVQKGSEKSLSADQPAGEGDRHDGWELKSQAKAMLTRLGVTDFGQKCGELSGGQKKRLALVATLLMPADILILDEPTNHLDNSMADWLEDYLKKWKGALVMVTHDRYFLDSVANRIIEIDKGNIYSCQSNYEGYLAQKAEREEMQAAGERKRQSILRNELAWMQRGARARSTKQKARIQRYEELKNAEGPSGDGRVEMGSVSSRMGRTTVELSHIGKAYGEKKLIEDFSYVFLKKDRVGFIGPNGCGKTTLMKILTGELQPDTGEVVVGQTIKIGYYAQEIASGVAAAPAEGGSAFIDLKTAGMDPSKRVIDYIRETAEYVQTGEGSITASQMLERFLFPGEEQYGLIGKLSGGEKRRLNLLRVLMEAPNVLILDEPTNDLDVTTLAILEDYLDSFDGIVITVSHDRYFLDRIVQRIFAFEGDGKLRQYEGGYTDYALRLSMEEREAAGEETRQGSGGGRIQGQEDPDADRAGRKGKPDHMKARKLKFTYQEQRDYETIEAEIASLEERAERLEQETAAAVTDFVKLNVLAKEKEEVETLLEEKMERWMYLEELAARIAAEN